MRFLARYYESGKDPLDFEVHEQGDHVHLTHIGGRSLPDKMHDKLHPKVILALTNFRNKMRNVMMLKTNVEVYFKTED